MTRTERMLMSGYVVVLLGLVAGQVRIGLRAEAPVPPGAPVPAPMPQPPPPPPPGWRYEVHDGAPRLVPVAPR